MKQGRDIRDAAIRKIDSNIEEIEDILIQYNTWLKLNAGLNNVKEAKKLIEIKKQLREICKGSITKEDLTEKEIKNPEFSHQGWNNQNQYFNIALSRLENLAESSQNFANQCYKDLENIILALESLKDVGKKTRSRLRTLKISEKFLLSNLILTRLKNYIESISMINGSGACQSIDTIAPSLSLSKILDDIRELYRPVEERYKEAEISIMSLENLTETEGEFHKSKDSFSKKFKTLSGIADVEPFRSNVEELGENASRVVEDYKLWRTEIEKTPLEKYVLHENINSLQSEVLFQSKSLTDITESLSNVWNSFVTEVKHFIGTINQLIQLVIKQKDSLTIKQIEKACDRLLNNIDNIDLSKLNRSMSYFESTKVEIRKAMMGVLKQSLNEVEGTILLVIVDKREKCDSGWFNMKEIIQEIANELNYSYSQVENLLRSLARKGYLVEGISIPI